jgi:hypothetical protein
MTPYILADTDGTSRLLPWKPQVSHFTSQDVLKLSVRWECLRGCESDWTQNCQEAARKKEVSQEDTVEVTSHCTPSPPRGIDLSSPPWRLCLSLPFSCWVSEVWQRAFVKTWQHRGVGRCCDTLVGSTELEIIIIQSRSMHSTNGASFTLLHVNSKPGSKRCVAGYSYVGCCSDIPYYVSWQRNIKEPRSRWQQLLREQYRKVGWLV